MKVLHINKTDSGGGAAVAARRIHNALRKEGIESRMLVEEKHTDDPDIFATSVGKIDKLKDFGRFVRERLTLLPHERNRQMRYNFSIANTGLDIASHPLVVEADIIHLHWFNQGFISLAGLRALMELGKPIFWTLHDMWAFSGGCHYAGSCLEYTEHCGFCPLLSKPSKTDASSVLFHAKKSFYEKAPLTVVACSRWLNSCASSSALLRKKKCISIPNPIDTGVFRPLDKSACRMSLGLPTDKKLLLFGAAKLSDVRKGYRYLDEALRIISDSFPLIASQVELIMFGRIKGMSGKHKHDAHSFVTHTLDFVRDTDTLVRLYNSADAFVLPSLQDNLPNTVMESMACGTPVVGFRIGGVPEMVIHGQTGYMAEVKNSLSLANGIVSVLLSNHEQMRQNTCYHAAELYSEHTVGTQYIKAYEDALSRHSK